MTDQPVEHDDDLYAATVIVSPRQVDELLRRGEFDFGDHPSIEPDPDGRTARLTLFVSLRQVEMLRGEGFAVELGANQSARARERLAEIGEGDRFEGGRLAPKGIGHKIRTKRS